MDPLLENFFKYFGFQGLYFGQPKHVRQLRRWRNLYMFVVTFIIIISGIYGIYVILTNGLAILYLRVGVDVQETTHLISSMGPITSIITIVAAISFFARLLHLYWTILRHDQQLIACISSSVFRQAYFSKTAAHFGLVAMISVQLLYYFNAHQIVFSNCIWWNLLSIGFLLICMAHYLFCFYLIIYFLLINIRCLSRLRTLIVGCKSTDTMAEMLVHLDLMVQNLERFLGVVSSHWLLLFFDEIIQCSFNLYFVYFQSNKKSMFLKNPAVVSGLNILTLLLMCCLSQMLVTSFGGLQRQFNKSATFDNKFARHQRDHWRVQAFLLGKEKQRFQPRVFHVFNVDLSSFINVIVFSFDFSIILDQTSSQFLI